MVSDLSASSDMFTRSSRTFFCLRVKICELGINWFKRSTMVAFFWENSKCVFVRLVSKASKLSIFLVFSLRRVRFMMASSIGPILPISFMVDRNFIMSSSQFLTCISVPLTCSVTSSSSRGLLLITVFSFSSNCSSLKVPVFMR